MRGAPLLYSQETLYLVYYNTWTPDYLVGLLSFSTEEGEGASCIPSGRYGGDSQSPTSVHKSILNSVSILSNTSQLNY